MLTKNEEKRRQELFNSLDIPEDCEKNCNFLEVTPDIFATGDSPTGYSCAGNCEVCPVIN